MKRGAVLITGAGSGIGAACAEEFLHQGRPVVLVSRRASRLKETARRLGTPERVLFLAGDVGDEKFSRLVFATARKRFGYIDVLVNNAAVLFKKPFLKTSQAEWDKTMATNLRGPFLFSREFLRSAKRGGVIINMGSLAGVQGTSKFPGLSAYTVSKYGISGLTAALAAEARPLGVSVVCIAPGAVDTAMLRKAAPGLKPRVVPSDIARVVAKMADPMAAHMLSGAILPLETNP